VFIAVYFLCISKYWLPFQIFGVCITGACVISIFFVPESPKYLISKKRYDEARQSLVFIARMNRYNGRYGDVMKFKFDREVIDE
jgi:Cu/Ag efflux pump CusA